MSGGIAQLVAVGAQDVHLVGQPEVSFFRSTYKRHTNFSQTVERQVIQGNVSNNGMSTVRFERKGDLLGYVYLVANDGTQAVDISQANWRTMISKVELLVGGQVIDEQDATFSTLIAPTLLATSTPKSMGADLSVRPALLDSTHSDSTSAKTGNLPSHSFPSSTTTWSSASRGVLPRRTLAESGKSSRTTRTWTPRNVKCLRPSHKI